jgi:hypothetical protein
MQRVVLLLDLSGQTVDPYQSTETYGLVEYVLCVPGITYNILIEAIRTELGLQPYQKWVG